MDLPPFKGRRAAVRVKILIVEDDHDAIEVISRCLLQDGFEIAVVRDGVAAVSAAHRERPDLVLLDLQLPGRSGLDVCRDLRADPVLGRIPIVMLTGLSAESDRTSGLEVGADDYIVKPFSSRELVLRQKAVMRRGHETVLPLVYRVGTLAVNVEQRNVIVNDVPIPLTPKEFAFLRTLIEANGRALSRAFLLRSVWGYSTTEDIRSRTIDVHVWNLRRKLGPESWRLETVDRYGYRLNPSA